MKKSAVLIFAPLLLLAMFFPANASNILFLTGNTTLSAGDNAAKTVMTGMGHTVNSSKTCLASATTDTAGQALVVISSSCAAADVGTKFKSVVKPVLSWNSGIFGNMAMTGTTSGTNFGTSSGVTQIAMQTSTNQMSAGLSGTVSVYTANDVLSWGVTGTGAQNIAALTTDATKRVIFGYATGAVMVGLNAPGIRVGFMMGPTSATLLTANGTSLFQSAINYALSAPFITTQPANATVSQPATATFSVTATGTTPTYQWRKNGTNISGATSASYTTPATASTDNGALFSVVVSNSAGSITSNNGTLTVNYVPIITTQPMAQTVNAGATATFTVVENGNPNPTLQWRKNGTNISGATSTSYTTPATTSADSGAQFSVVVVNSLGSVSSNNAALNVISPPSINTQPTNQTVNEGQTATFSVTAGGVGPFSYQWKKNTTNISGAASASYTTPITVASDSGATFQCVVSNGAGSTSSIAAILSVRKKPVITVQPSAVSVQDGQPATFSVTATGFAPLLYQWLRNGSAISGATSATYTLAVATLADNGASFSCTVSNTPGSVTSNAIVLTVTPAPPTIPVMPVPVTVTPGQTATFQITATGTAPLSYQWLKFSTPIAGATSASYTTPPVTLADSGTLFSCRVSNSAGSVTSTTAMLSVSSKPVQSSSALISITGQLTDSMGQPLGHLMPITKDITVQLFPAKTGGTAVHVESFLAVNHQAVTVKEGLFTVRLGEGAAQTTAQDVLSLFPDLYAEFLVGDPGSQETLSPRVPVTSPAYVGSPHIQRNAGIPSAVALAGTIYQNTTDNSVWIRVPGTWVKLSN